MGNRLVPCLAGWAIAFPYLDIRIHDIRIHLSNPGRSFVISPTLKLLVCQLLCGVVASACAEDSRPRVRAEPLTPIVGAGAGFTRMDPRSCGILWTNTTPPDRYKARQNSMNGAGVAFGDFDGDGQCDLFLCGKYGRSALFRNLGGWTFEDVTAVAGVGCTDQIASGATFADFDGDGRLDLFVTSFAGPNACFRNLGEGRFTNVTEAVGLRSRGGSTSQALADVDGDGWLDLYTAYFGMEAILRDGAAISTRTVNGQPVVTGRHAKRVKIVAGKLVEIGEPDFLHRNQAGTRFSPLPWEQQFSDENGRPSAAPLDFGLAVQIRDIDQDGLPDIYVCNDFQTPDRLWLNRGQGQFRAAPREALRNMSYASMGVDFADIDRDGRLDFVTVEMLSRSHRRHIRQSSPRQPAQRLPGVDDEREDFARNALYWNRGDGTYAEIAWFAGVAASDWSWTPIFLDVDLDGYEDLLISNGHLHDVNDQDIAAGSAQRRADLLGYPRLEPGQVAFRNERNLRFTDRSVDWGFHVPVMAHGMALGDLDNDGDLDVVANSPNAPPLIYRNEAAAPRIAVRLIGRSPNTEATGARITYIAGGLRQMQEILAGGRYLSGDQALRTFAALAPEGQIEVAWRSGARSTFPVSANHRYVIEEPAAGQPAAPSARPVPAPLFEDWSQRLPHRHTETLFDDFQRQPLLPKRLSQLGPGLAWVDLHGEGRDALAIGSGRGGQVTTWEYRNGQFVPGPILSEKLPDDSAGLAGWHGPDGLVLIAGLAGYEQASAENSPARFLGASKLEPLPKVPDSSGPIALADVDGDGDLDLFVGGRLKAGRYPHPASSRLYRFEAGRFVPDEPANALLRDAGLVSGAVFSDLNGDGFAELILACEWGSIRVFAHRNGTLTEATAPLGFDRWPGLWTSIAAGDFDGDGRMDLAAGNWGWNTHYRRAGGGGIQLAYGDFAGDGGLTVLENYVDPETQRRVTVRDLNLLSSELPWLKQVFPTHAAFAEADLDRLLGDRRPLARDASATTFESMVFLNRGNHFEPVRLPAPAQWAPLFGLVAADFDGDGFEDLFAAQNFFACRPEDDRLDAGRGLLLRGDGRGGFAAVDGAESGLRIYGDQRGAAAADFDADGRLDLAVAQNGGATRLLRNTQARPGLRIRLAGPPGNPRGFGAMLTPVRPSGPGAARELACGSGYWSQNSATTVLAVEAGSAIEVRWPGGAVTRTPVPEGARELVISAPAK